MKKIGYIVCAIVVAFFAFIIAIPIVNDNVAKKTAEKVKKIQLPADTEYMETFSEAGKLVGNGNGMQYLGGILIKSDQSLKELQTYYSQYAQKEWECIVEKQKGREIQFVEHGAVSLNTDIDGDGYYIVYSWGDSDTIFDDLDIRGH